MAEIRLVFRGKEYVIPDSKAFEIGARVERIATLGEVLSWRQGDPRFFPLSQCLGEMLRFAGCDVTDREVKDEVMAAYLQTDPAPYFAALLNLVNVLMDGAPELASRATKAADGAGAGKDKAS